MLTEFLIERDIPYLNITWRWRSCIINGDIIVLYCHTITSVDAYNDNYALYTYKWRKQSRVSDDDAERQVADLIALSNSQHPASHVRTKTENKREKKPNT